MSIYRMIGSLGHGKDIVDCINSCDKRFLKVNICMISIPKGGDYNNRMISHLMIYNIYITVWRKTERYYVYIVIENFELKIIVTTRSEGDYVNVAKENLDLKAVVSTRSVNVSIN